MLDPNTRKAVLADLLDHEGCVPWLYCDTKGFVTIGVGNLVKTAEDAVKLPMFHLFEQTHASEAEKRTAWGVVHGAYGANQPAIHYRSFTDLRITRECAQRMLGDRVDNEFVPALERLFHSFGQWPQAAQRGAVDMIYNLGIHGMDGISHYPNFVAAGQRGDFKTMAQECIRASGRRAASKDDPEGLGPRNRWTRARFEEAADGTTPTG